ncbi:uncharacterized protein K02A2.6 [Nematostella vectensis]|uniref:uncharacterized protein K02A2.6 n=1 Tax=Nematostella vectensis TaxID=45351 RepID=UPI002077240C|nr:uncharacterized protein K02A2.6 [Nematostella vectensis]
MPFGIATAPEEYQRCQHEVLEGLQGIYVVADDILITGQGETEEEALRDHDSNLVALLERARQVNLKLNPKKLKLRLPEVPYIGHLLTPGGVKPDPEKVRAVQEMPRPDGKSKAEKIKAVQRFLGFVNYLAKFVPHLADESEQLRRLTDKEAEWAWEQHYQDAFDTTIQVSDDGLKRIQKETECDETLQRLKETVLQGWPETKQEADPRVAEYWTYRDEISVYNGVLYKGERVIVPSSLRKTLMSRVHASHQGEQACLRRARDALFWPGMSQQIRDLVSSCSLCADHVPAQTKEPLMTPELPKRPWSIVAQDLYTLNGKDFLITVDAYSGFWEVDELTQATAANVINKTKQHFARYGIPDRVYSDNGPQFANAEYTTFASSWKFEHQTSSPYHSQSNGLIEAAVKSAKNLQKKANKSGRDVWMSFLDHRNTPTEGMDSSPVQRLMSKRTKTTLPLAQHLLEPELQQDVTEKLTLKRKKAKKHFDRGSKELPELNIGKPVRMTSLPKETKK